MPVTVSPCFYEDDVCVLSVMDPFGFWLVTALVYHYLVLDLNGRAVGWESSVCTTYWDYVSPVGLVFLVRFYVYPYFFRCKCVWTLTWSLGRERFRFTWGRTLARLFGVTRMAYSPRLWLLAIGWWNKINQCRKLKLNLTQTWGVCTMVTMGGDLQPGSLADRLLTGLGQPQINP